MAEEMTRSYRQYRALLFIVLGACYLIVFFHRNALGVVAVDMMDDLGVQAALMGLLSAGYFYPYAFMQLPTGLLSDSWGARKTIVSFLAIAAAGSLLFGASSGSGGVLVGRILVGIGVSTIYVCTFKIIADWYHGTEFATMNALLVSVGGIGLMISTVPLAWLSTLYGWRTPFVATGIITLALVAVVWLFVKDSPEEHRSGRGTAPHPNATWEAMKRTVATIVGSRRFWPANIWMMCTFSIYIAFGGLWGGPYLMHVYGLTKIEASRILLMIAVAMIVGSPLLGVLSDRIFKLRKRMLSASSALLATTFTIIILFIDTLPMAALYVLTLCIGLFAVGIMPVGYASIKDLFPRTMAGTATGIANLFPFLVGALLQPSLGLVLEAVGKNGGVYTAAAYQYAFCILLACSLVAFVC
ncbi:MAG TPA: MFS transporter, partial [Methanomicrobia archaeon]|nr:MFS transporter [Methanomicrobia archaeon]